MKKVEISRERYDELLRNEALLEVIKRCHSKTTGYSFHEVVSFLLSELETKR